MRVATALRLHSVRDARTGSTDARIAGMNAAPAAQIARAVEAATRITGSYPLTWNRRPFISRPMNRPGRNAQCEGHHKLSDRSADHHTNDERAGCPDRLADPDLAGAARHEIRHYPYSPTDRRIYERRPHAEVSRAISRSWLKLLATTESYETKDGKFGIYLCHRHEEVGD